MTLSVDNYLQNTYDNFKIPSFRMSTPAEMVSKANKIAIPAIALVAALNIPKADGGVNAGVIIGCAVACVAIGAFQTPPTALFCAYVCSSLFAPSYNITSTT